MGRKRSTPHSFRQTLTDRAERLKAEAAKMAPGDARDAMLRQAHELETTAHMDDWLTAPGVRATQ